MTEQLVESAAEKQEPYNAREITALVVGSFKFSRGNAHTQYSILDFLAAKYGRSLSLEEVTASKDASTKTAFNIYMNADAHPQPEPIDPFSTTKIKQPEEIYAEVGEEVVRMSDFLLRKAEEYQASPPKAQYDNLQIALVSADYRWIREKNGFRHQIPGRSYGSNLVQFGFLGHSTKIPEFDDMFGVVTYDFPNPGTEIHTVRDLKDVVSAHIQTHPDQARRLAWTEQRIKSILILLESKEGDRA